MAAKSKVRVAVNGYGVIGKRVAHAVTLQDDMTLTGVVDVVSDWRAQAAARMGMRKAALPVHGTLEDELHDVDIAVDCTPKRIAAVNVETYRQRKVKYVVQGGQKHSANPDIGLLLPCNVVVREEADAAITASFMDAEAVLKLVDKPEMTVIGKEVRELLQRVCASLKA